MCHQYHTKARSVCNCCKITFKITNIAICDAQNVSNQSAEKMHPTPNQHYYLCCSKIRKKTSLKSNRNKFQTSCRNMCSTKRCNLGMSAFNVQFTFCMVHCNSEAKTCSKSNQNQFQNAIKTCATDTKHCSLGIVASNMHTQQPPVQGSHAFADKKFLDFSEPSKRFYRTFLGLPTSHKHRLNTAYMECNATYKTPNILKFIPALYFSK